MSRYNHPSELARTPERHLHAVPEPEGNALVGVFWGLLFTAAVVGLIVLAVAGCSATPEQQPCNGCTITEGWGG